MTERDLSLEAVEELAQEHMDRARADWTTNRDVFWHEQTADALRALSAALQEARMQAISDGCQLQQHMEDNAALSARLADIERRAEEAEARGREAVLREAEAVVVRCRQSATGLAGAYADFIAKEIAALRNPQPEEPKP